MLVIVFLHSNIKVTNIDAMIYFSKLSVGANLTYFERRNISYVESV